MRKIVKILFAGYIVCIMLNCKQAYGQQNHFIYIQADEKQTFSVEVNNKTFTSSDIGYVIIPKLTDGKYNLNISFSNNKFPNQQFNCVINKADAGYALKNFGEKGWGLFNFQSLEVTMAGNNSAIAETQSDTIKTQIDTTKTQNDTVKPNAFGEMLAQVVNDTSLKVAPVDQPANKQPVGIVTVPASQGDSLKNAQNQMPATNTMVVLNKSMRKIDEQQTGEGVNMVFVDPNSGNDTIKIFVPSVQAKKEDSAVAKNETKDVTVDTNQSVPEVTKEDKNPLPDTTSTTLQSQVNNPFFSGKQTKDTVSKTTVENNPGENKPGEASSSQIVYKPDCTKMLSDNDLDKIKKKMVSGNNNEKMIQTAKKYLQDKCITTEQVKSLGALFLSDDARYSFFDTAYPNVYDISTFASLENQLVDPYYKRRFKAMLK